MAYRTTEADLLMFCRSKLLSSTDSPEVRAQRINLRLSRTGISKDLALANIS